jgi:hypothetical protein
MVDDGYQGGDEMNSRCMRWSAVALLSGTFLVLSSGCVATADGDYGANVNVGIGLDYYDQFGYDYGSWGPDYAVGPYRGGGDRPRRGDPHGGHESHGFRPAAPSRAMPSIPMGARAGGRGRH